MVVWKTNIQWHIHNNRIKHTQLDFTFWPAGYNLEHEEELALLARVYETHEALPEPRDPLVYIVKNPFKNAGSGEWSLVVFGLVWFGLFVCLFVCLFVFFEKILY
jgi:hypothetical protein